MYTVYKHTCPNGKCYVGITAQKPQTRWGRGSGYKEHNKHFFAAIEKYGWENIKHEILFEGLTKEQAEQKEIELIALYKSNKREYGYNKSIGGEHSSKGVKRTEEQRRAISERQKGKHLTEKEKQRLRVLNLGNRHTEETRAKMSDARKGKPQNAEWVENRAKVLRGKKRTQEVCKKFSEIRKGKNKGGENPHASAVLQYDSLGNLIAMYGSIAEATTATGTNRTSISCCCSGRYKAAGGYIWRYANAI